MADDSFPNFCLKSSLFAKKGLLGVFLYHSFSLLHIVLRFSN